MQLLTATTHVFRVVTDAVVALDVVASFYDKNGSAITPQAPQTTAINAATTTTVVAAPSSSIQRGVKSLSLRNKGAAVLGVTVQFFDGTTAYEVIKRSLSGGEEFFYEDHRGWYPDSTSPKVTHTVLTTVGAGTYNTPAGVKAFIVETIGGGGGGGGCANAATNGAAAGGGGGGAYTRTLVTSPAASYAYVVGDGGAGGVAGANNGTVGTDTSFGTAGAQGLAKGGSGGVADTVALGPRIAGAGGAGGAAASSTGDVKIDGNPGDAGLALAAAQSLSGRGGAAGGTFEGGAAAAVKNATAAGNAGGKYGGGGSGACIISGGANQAGGKGAQGIIVVTEFR